MTRCRRLVLVSQRRFLLRRRGSFSGLFLLFLKSLPLFVPGPSFSLLCLPLPLRFFVTVDTMLLPLMITRTEAGDLAGGILVLPPGSCILRARQRARCPSLPRLDFPSRGSSYSSATQTHQDMHYLSCPYKKEKEKHRARSRLYIVIHDRYSILREVTIVNRILA